jgi:hypothetical protein
MLERPPLNVIVEACRVEGMTLPVPAGGYTAPLMLLSVILQCVAVGLTMDVFAFTDFAFIVVVFKPPLRLAVPLAESVFAFKLPLKFAVPFTVAPPLRVVRPFTENVLVATAGALNCAIEPFTTRPA